MFRHAVVTEVAPAPFRGERSSRKVRRKALQPEKLEERLPRPALAVDKQIFEGHRMYARVALREAELPREAVPHPSEGRLARVPLLDPGPVRGGARLINEHDGHARGSSQNDLELFP